MNVNPQIMNNTKLLVYGYDLGDEVKVFYCTLKESQKMVADFNKYGTIYKKDGTSIKPDYMIVGGINEFHRRRKNG